ncbi:MAG: hypothetical protein IPJ85_00905 [Flavobacteriales bacterium]|nr:hypothetical protein [Flavobacteriales bacterium]
MVPDHEHPDHLDGTVTGTDLEDAGDERDGASIALPFRICGPVSGRYSTRRIIGPLLPTASREASLFDPFGMRVTVRVDVDRYYPQRRISVEFKRKFPSATLHVIAEVTRDRCTGLNTRRIEADITYRNGDGSLITGDRLVFDASRTTGKGYGAYMLSIIGPGKRVVKHELDFRSRYFDSVEFEVDRVDNAGTPVTSFDTSSHPNRPASLPSETIDLVSVYKRAGFDASSSPNGSVIPLADAGANRTWSDSEMHNAMVTYWSRFADRPQWAMWVLYAARHDDGRSLGGIMFDDIGPNHRQGTAIFRDSFIQDAPPGDPAPAAWRRRMEFWTAVHEMGHGFNLAHAWQKALGTPWVPLTNDSEARSFMNYPFRVSGGEASFFDDFAFRFIDDELTFMRHAPRRFVQMGNENWFDNHAFEAPDAHEAHAPLVLRIRPNKDRNVFRFLEPVTLELKLTNQSSAAIAIEHDLLREGSHISVLVKKDGAATRQWRPMVAHCHAPASEELKPGASVYGAHVISTSTSGWLIDEPGSYTVQAAVSVGGQTVLSAPLRLRIASPSDAAENDLAGDWFTEDVGRALFFNGAPALTKAHNTLQEVMERCPENPAALHASVALSAPKLRPFKQIDFGADGVRAMLRSDKVDIDGALRVQRAALLKTPDATADSFGHIPYFDALEHLANALVGAGANKEARSILGSSIDLMKKRKVLDAVVKATERKLSQMK